MKDMIEAHKKIILQFSGGKDSLACLYLCREWWWKITVAWVNTGDAFPETIALMKRVREAVPHFVEVPSNQPKFIKENGWPVDILPVRNTEYGNRVEEGAVQQMVGYPACCSANIWQPMEKFVDEFGASLVIRGTKGADKKKVRLKHGDTVSGVQYAMPVFDLSDSQVVNLIWKGEFGMPGHYKYVNSSLDCIHCTAYLSENAGKMFFMRDFHPAHYADMSIRLTKLAHIVDAELDHIKRAK